MSDNTSRGPVHAADQIMAVEVFSQVLAATDASQLGEKLTEQLRELTGARTVMVITHGDEPHVHKLLHACPTRRKTLFSAADLDLLCPENSSALLPGRVVDFPPNHPLQALLLHLGIESLLRVPLYAANRLVGMLLLLDLPALERIDEMSRIVTHLSPVLALALRNALAHRRIEQQAQQLDAQTRELEQRVAERTAELKSANETLETSRLAALSLMENAVEARERADKTAVALQQEITERKRNETIMQARLRLLEFAGSHTLNELLTATLDEVEALTGSTIGFYHFVDADQQTLTLHSWSTNTINNMCKAEGANRHYAVDQAGVWADCVRQRRPLIHNDYASLPDRKGKPEGHATVIREVVVPIFRGELITAVIGVGNKLENYDETDIEVVSQLGDLSWDVAERMRVEENLRLMNERYALATLAADLGVWDWNIQNNELVWDDRMYELYGVKREDFTGAYEAWLQGIHPDDRIQSDEISKRAQRGECEYDTEFRVVWPDGSIHWLKAYGEIVRDAQDKPLRMTGVNYDITERRQTEGQIRELNQELEQRVADRTKQLEAANKELESFAYSVSHDLRAPLRAIDGFSHILLEDYADKLDEEGKRLFKVVCDNTVRMGQLIEDILKFSRSGRLEMNFYEIDMEKMARAVFAELRPAVAESKLQFEIEPMPEARGDSAMIHQVFVNLFSNAIKFSRTREAPLIKVGARVERNETIYYVKDNGVGFEMQYAEKLFSVFQRLCPVDEFEGTGIGLAIVKRIISRHGGRVWAEGKINEGATFYFALPHVDAKEVASA